MRKTIKNETARKIGLIYSISILIGTVVGVGIFLKNKFVFDVNNGNYIGILVAWIIAAIISLATAWSFGEVGSCSNKKGGVGYWIKKLLHNKFGNFVNVIQPFFYYTIIVVSISIFASETFFRMFDFNQSIHIAAILGFAFLLLIFFIVINFVSFNTSKKIQLILSTLKILPIIFVVVFGILFAIKQDSSSLFTNAISKTSSFSFTSVIISLPSILFAFDSFTGVGNLSSEIKKPKKNVPLTIIIGMSLVVVVYLLITISLIFTGDGNALNIFDNANFINSNAKNALNVVFTLFLFISIVGVLNGFSSISTSSWQLLVDEDLICKSKIIKKIFEKNHTKKELKNKSGFALNIIFSTIFMVLISIPSIIDNTDAYVDGVSNFPTTVFFGIYGIAVLGALVNRKRKKVEVHNIYGFYITAPIAIIGCLFVLGFQFFYTFSFQNIVAANDTTGWGLFYNNYSIIENWKASILFFIYISLLPITYFLNKWITSLDNKKNLKNNNNIIFNAIKEDIEQKEIKISRDYNEPFLKEIRRFNE